MSQIRRPPQKAKILLSASTNYFFPVKLAAGIVGSIQVQWHDATSQFTIVAHTSNVEDPPVPDPTGTVDAEFWMDETAPGNLVFGAATASAAGCDLQHIGNNGAKWLLLEFVVAANSIITITVHEKD